MKAILLRLSEPSSMAGIAALVGLFGADAGLSESVAHIVAGVAAVAAVAIKEKGTA